MAGEQIYTTVSIVRKLIEKKVQKLHEFLDEKKQALNQELDKLEETFSADNEKDEQTLKKWTEYKEQTLDLFREEEGVESAQISRIEYRIKTITQKMEMRRIRLEWDDDIVRQELKSLGKLVTCEQQDSHSHYEDLQSMSLDVNYEEIDEGMMDNNFSAPKETPLRENRPTQTKNKPGEYLKPVRAAPKAPSRTPPRPPQPPQPPQPGMKTKHSFDLLDNLKRPAWRTKSLEGVQLDSQESDLYCKVPDQKPGWPGLLRKKSGSVGDKLNLTGLQSPRVQDYRVISKCGLGSGPGQILKPKNVAVSTKTGCIFVAEKGNNRVQVFAPTGDPMYSFGKRIKGPSMQKPYGLCVLNENVYVSQTQSNCVMMFRTNGEYLIQSGQEGKGEGCFDFPTGLTTDGTRIFVCDCGNNRVQVLSDNLTFKQLVGVGKLNKPTDIAVDTGFNLVVLDRSICIVHIFNCKGVYLRKLINVSRFPTLSNPLFIAISPRGNIIISDLLTCSINIFTTDGQLLWSLGGVHDKDTFGEPRGVTCDMLGRLVVACNKQEGCLKIIQFSNDMKLDSAI